MTRPRTDYCGERPSALVLRLEQRAREQRMAFLAPASLFTRLAKFIRRSFGL